MSSVPHRLVICTKSSLLGGRELDLGLRYITIPDPKYEQPQLYILQDGGRILEALAFSEPYRSWFIGEAVLSDGRVLFLTPLDPLFLIIPLLQKFADRNFIPFEDLFFSEAYPDYQKVYHSVSPAQVKTICNHKEINGSLAFKYSEEKVLIWLKLKTTTLQNFIMTSGVRIPLHKTANYKASSISTASIDKEQCLRHAFNIVSDYVKDDLSEKLREILNLPSKKELKEQCDTNEEEVEGGRALKKTKVEPLEDYSGAIGDVKDSKPAAATVKQTQLAKAAKGTKSIMSFFSKKTNAGKD